MPCAISYTFVYVGNYVASSNQLCVTWNVPYKEIVVVAYEQTQWTWGWPPFCSLNASSLGNRVEFEFQSNVHAII
jgi:hypothetical protein